MMLRACARSNLIVIVRAAALAKLLTDNVARYHAQDVKKPFVLYLFGWFVCLPGVLFYFHSRGCTTPRLRPVPQPAASASRFAMDASSSPPLKALVALQLLQHLTGPLVKSSARLASLLSLLLLPLTVLLPSPKHLCYRVAVKHLWCRGENVKKEKENKCIMCPPAHQVIIMRKKS
jgi:hypothetical protein